MKSPTMGIRPPPGLRHAAVGVLGAALVLALGVTHRVVRLGAHHYRHLRLQGRPLIFVCWHAHLLPLVHAHRGEGIVTLNSEHADGEYLTRTLHHLGFGAVRGSASRGGARGLRGLITAARRGRDLGLAPDGPRGPARVVKAGALVVSQATGLPLVPVAVGASEAWMLRSWDRFLVPRPFARVCLAYGSPRSVPREAGRGWIEGAAAELGAELDALERQAAAEVAR